MTSKVVVETHVRTFVNSKISEDVAIELMPKRVTIASTEKRGSTVLALLWANVLQHTDNFPKNSYHYSEGFDNVTKSTTLCVSVDGIQITLHMKSGKLVLEGEFIFSWLQDTFPAILKTYDKAVCMTRNDYLYLQKLEEMRTMGLEESEDSDKAEVNDAMYREDDYRSVSSKVDCPSADVSLPSSQKYKPRVLADEDLELQTSSLNAGCVKSGPGCVYDLWRTLLNKWFSDSETKVFIVTPYIDVQRVVDICQVIMHNALTANLDSLCVKNQCAPDKKFSDVHRDVLEKYKPKQQLFIEYKIFNRVVFPVDDFSCSFICGVRCNIAELFLTSASFSHSHFDVESMSFVSFGTMPEDKFLANYMLPLTSPKEIA